MTQTVGVWQQQRISTLANFEPLLTQTAGCNIKVKTLHSLSFLISLSSISPLPPSRSPVRMCWVNHVTGVWVYPLLEQISPLAKVAFFFCLTVLINIYYVLGEVLNSYIWDGSKCKPSARLAAAPSVCVCVFHSVERDSMLRASTSMNPCGFRASSGALNHTPALTYECKRVQKCVHTLTHTHANTSTPLSLHTHTHIPVPICI